MYKLSIVKIVGIINQNFEPSVLKTYENSNL